MGRAGFLPGRPLNIPMPMRAFPLALSFAICSALACATAATDAESSPASTAASMVTTSQTHDNASASPSGSGAASTPAPGSAEAVVAAQLDAYNRRDLDAFMATFHAEAELFSLGDSTPRAQGHDAVRAIYGELFENSPDLRSELVHRSVIGTKVIDHERITGRAGSDGVLELVMVYEVEDGGIRRAWAIRP